MAPPAHIRLRVRNSRSADTAVLLEPWGMPVSLKSGETLDIELDGPSDGVPEVDACDAGPVIYGWPGSRIIASKDGVVVFSSAEGPAVPDVPTGLTMRDFVKSLFGR